MKIHDNIKTQGEKVIKELEQFLKGCVKQTKDYSKLSGEEKRILRTAWAREFFRSKGLIEKPVDKNQARSPD